MRTCIRIPRILIPEGNFEKWAVIACDRFATDREYWERVKRLVGDAPSTLNFILPEIYAGEEDEERVREARESLFRALEEGDLAKLNRGMVLCERETQAGVRRGIIAAVDLEAFTSEKGVVSPVRASQEVDASRLPARVALRRNMPAEFSHVVLFYRDKRRRLVHALMREDLEELYDFKLMEDGGRLKGYFIPEDLAEEVAQELQSGAEPYFAVADGNCSMAAAKAHWEKVKEGLSAEEKRNHPARFVLAEFVNLYEESVTLRPVHRLVKEVEEPVFCDYMARQFRCRQAGSVLYPLTSAGAEEVRKIDEAIETFLRQNGGKTDYVIGDERLAKAAREEDCVGIALRPIEKDDFFEQLARGVFPQKTFSVGGEEEARYYLEGKEISYD